MKVSGENSIKWSFMISRAHQILVGSSYQRGQDVWKMWHVCRRTEILKGLLWGSMEEGRRPPARPMHEWQENITTHLNEVGWDSVDWINWDQGLEKCYIFCVQGNENLCHIQNIKNFSTSQGTISCPQKDFQLVSTSVVQSFTQLCSWLVGQLVSWLHSAKAYYLKHYTILISNCILTILFEGM